MTEVTPMSMGTIPMRSLACLAEKLNKYRTTESNNGMKTPEAMDINMEEKKRARTANPQAISVTAIVAINKSPSSEVKKLSNDETPTPHAQAKALFLNQTKLIKQGLKTGTEELSENKAICKESEKLQEVSSLAEHQDTTTGQKETLKETPDKIIITKESKNHSTMK